MKPNAQLHTFLKPYDPRIRELALQLRTFITDTVPQANELIWDNYNAVAIAYSKTEQLKGAFCHIAVYAHHVNFGFNRGTELPSSTLGLKGKGKHIRHLKVTDFQTFQKSEVEKLLLRAVALSDADLPKNIAVVSAPKSMVMSISERKKRP